MIDQQITTAFTAALSKWVTAAALHLDQERMELLGVSLEADDMGVRVVVRRAPNFIDRISSRSDLQRPSQPRRARAIR